MLSGGVLTVRLVRTPDSIHCQMITLQEICLYRVKGLSHSFRGEAELYDVLYSEKAMSFKTYFQHIYTVTVAPENEFLIKVGHRARTILRSL